MKVDKLEFCFRMLLEEARKVKPSPKHFVFTPEEAQQVVRMLNLLTFNMFKGFDVSSYSKNMVSVQVVKGLHGEVKFSDEVINNFPVIKETNVKISDSLRGVMKSEFSK